MATRLAVFALLLAARAGVSAQLPPGGGNSPEVLAANLRQLLLDNIPPVLYEDNKHWGQQKTVTRGLTWKEDGPHKQKSAKNHGVWRRTRFTAVNPRNSLKLEVRGVTQDGPDRKIFTTFVAFDTRVEGEQQNWRKGVRLFSGSFKARLRVKAVLQCEVTTKLVKSKDSFVPDVVFRMRVLTATIGYSGFKTEHVAGVGGEVAEWIGEAGHGLMNQLKPSIERHLLEQANAAIVRAGDTKEVRVSLGKLFGK